MPEELPQPGKFVTVAFDSGDTAYPIIACVKANKENGYVVPAIGSPCPDPRYAATHVFTRVVPTSIDGRVWWYYEKLPGPWVTTQEYLPKSNTYKLISRRRNITANIVEDITLTAGANDTVTVVESEAIDAYTSTEISTTWTEPVARNETIGDANGPIVTHRENRPYQFPDLMSDLDMWIASDGLVGHSPGFIERVPHTTYTNWIFSATAPTPTINGSLSLAMVDSLLGNAQPISDLIIDGGDDYFVGGLTITISASTPNYATYISDYIGGGPRAILGKVTMINRYVWEEDRDFIQFIRQAAPVITETP